MNMTSRDETNQIVAKMVKGLASYNKDYAIGYLESFISNLINDNVKDESELNMLRIRMLGIGIEHLIDAKKLS